MSEPNSNQAKNPFVNGEAENWTKDQWNAYVSSENFIRNFSEKGVVEPTQLAKAIGLKGYLMLMENCPHLVVYKDKIIDADTSEGKEVLEGVQLRGELPFPVLIEAGIISGDKADDRIQDAIGIAGMCLQPGGIWDDEAYTLAMLWSPDQWRESMRYSNFAKHFVRGGIVQIGRLKKTDIPSELLNRMIRRALNLVTVEDRVIDADTDEGVQLLEKYLVDGQVSLARLIEADVFTKSEAVKMHQDAVQFASDFLNRDTKWAEEDKKIIYSWIPEQWDAFVDTSQFDSFIEDGFVDAQRLKKLMGAELFNIMISKVHTLIETGARIVTASTASGKERLQEAVQYGQVTFSTLVRAGLYSQTEVDKKISEARKISELCFQEGAKWDSLSTKDAMKWSADEWDAATTGSDFVRKFVKRGILQREKFVGVMEEDLYSRMVKRSTHLIPFNHKIIDVHTANGKDLAETGLWDGDIPIHLGVKMGLISREQASSLHEEARSIAKENFQEDKKWNASDKKAALKWSEDQWEKALEVVNFSELFTENGIVARDRAVVAMGPALYDAMVKRIRAFVTIGSTVYDASTKEGYNYLKEAGAL